MRNMTLGAKALLLGGVALASVTHADAALFTVAWEGTLDYGWYYASASDPGTDLTGRAFKVVYTIDDSKGIDGSSPPLMAYLYGGSDYGAASPVSAVFTIDGLGAYSVLGDYRSSAYRVNADPDLGYDYDALSVLDYQLHNEIDGQGTYLWQEYSARAADSGVYETDSFSHGTLLDSTVWGSPPARAFVPTDFRYNQFSDHHYRYDYQTGTYDQYTSLYAYSYNGSWVSSPPPAIPEPSTWAMMIAGLGTVGYAMRRRSVRVAFG